MSSVQASPLPAIQKIKSVVVANCNCFTEHTLVCVYKSKQNAVTGSKTLL
jgi:hypothetical protein